MWIIFGLLLITFHYNGVQIPAFVAWFTAIVITLKAVMVIGETIEKYIEKRLDKEET